MDKPKIYCTLGNTTDTIKVVAGMIKAGMRGARINTAYCGFEEYSKRIEMVREEASKLGTSIPIMMDIKGPQLRLHTTNPDMGYSIEQGIVFPLGFGGDLDDKVDIYLNYNIKDQLKEGDTLLIENGTIVTRVIENEKELYVQVVNAGEGIIRNQMGVNIPGRYLELPHLTEKDKEVIDYSLQQGLEYIALSFARDEGDMKYLQDYIMGRKKELKVENSPGLVAKIEDKFGCINLQKIIESVDREEFEFLVMIARGDLFNEINYTKLAHAQQVISKVCHKAKVPVMIGTGLLESMKYGSRPIRAEVCDVWNALRDNPEYLMLSAETSNGKNPVLAVNTLANIVNEYYRNKKV